MINKVFEKLVNNRFVDTQNFDHFSDFQYGFTYSRSVARLLIDVGLFELWHIQDFWQVRVGLGYAGLHRIKSCEISGGVFGLILSFLSNRQLLVVLDGELHKKFQWILVFLKASFLVLHFSCYTLMTFRMISSVILLSMLMMLLCTLSVIKYSICGNNYNQLTSKLESDLRDTELR